MNWAKKLAYRLEVYDRLISSDEVDELALVEWLLGPDEAKRVLLPEESSENWKGIGYGA